MPQIPAMNIYRCLAGLRSPTSTAELESTEEILAEVEEPPETLRDAWIPGQLTYQKETAIPFARRESLLTRQLHSENEWSEEDHQTPSARASGSYSTWSVQSAASTAELTSDDGRSISSPAISPPLAATYVKSAVPVAEKPFGHKIKIVGSREDAPLEKESGAERTVEANLGRRRCITFACGNKETRPRAQSPTPSAVESSAPSSPPKRKCTIQFVCPNRPTQQAAPTDATPARRNASPAPPRRRTSTPTVSKTHRGSDSTVTRGSPRSVRKVPSATPASTTAQKSTGVSNRMPRGADSDDSGPEGTRFHEFATSDEEPEPWTLESTVHRSRLTISDTLRKENVIRRACEEVEEEAIEEGEDDDDEDDEDADDLGTSNDLDEDDQDEDEADDESDESDEGFHSDNEEGFAESDSDSGEDSDFEWWKPGGPSTAATSVEHLDRLVIKPEDELASSLGSVSSGHMSPRTSRHYYNKVTRKNKGSHAVNIPRPDTPELPDSTDFVAGTLDEDRPLEQAYINNMKGREAAKHRARPQDIDPTFPTSDPEMDEEDDDDLVDPSNSEDEKMMHGDLENLDGEGTIKARRSPRPSRRNTNISPAPTQRLRSPPPPSRHHSPPPKRRVQPRSPPPSKRTGHQSPRRLRSPAPATRKTSPSSTRPVSPHGAQHAVSDDTFGLPERVNVTHAASLPRGGAFRLSTLVPIHSDDEDTENARAEAPKRGAIDIVKGLERKRKRRKEKLYQKMCAKAAAKGEKAYKVKPGKGAERMREVGLELQRYKGKGEHIISV